MRARSFVAALLFVACSEIDPLELGTCGNGVLEAGEQCDVVGGPGIDGKICGGALEGAGACKFLCSPETAATMCNPGDACRISDDPLGGLGVCVSENVCGNDQLEVENNEECDGPDLGGITGDATRPPLCGSPAMLGAGCRFVCDSDHACPDGYSCGSGGVCVFHSGKFQEQSRVPFAGLDLVVADYDGDFNLDISSIFGHDLEIRYGDGGGGFSDSRRVAFRAPTFQIAAADFDVDGYDDAVVPQDTGLSVLRGRSDRTLIAQLDADIPIGMASPFGIRSANVRTSSSPENNLIFGTGYGQGMFVAFIVDPEGAQDPNDFYAFPSMLTPAAVLDLVVAELDAGDPSPEDEVIIALAGDDRLRIVSPECTLENGVCVWSVIFRSEVLLPDRASGAPHLGDLDGDDILDLIVPVGEPGMQGDRRLAAGRGTGAGRFVSFEDGGSTLSYDDALDRLFDARRGEEPSIAGLVDFNYDGIADLITDEFVAISTGPRSWERSRAVELFGPSVSSVSGDFNGDGQVDFATSSASERGLTFFLGDGTGSFRSTFIATNHFPVSLEVGDFDGDGVDDVVAAEGEGLFNILATSISVIYGNPFSLPSPAVEMGELPRIAQLDTFDIFFPPARPDGLDDVVVISDPSETEGPAVTLLFGDTSRRLFSPLTLSTGNSPPDRPLGVTKGDFDGDGLSDIFVLGSSSAWMLSGQPGGLTLENSRSVRLDEVPLASCLVPASPMCSMLVAGNVLREAGARIDEAVYLDACDIDPEGMGSVLHLSWIRAPSPPQNWSCDRLDFATPFYRGRGIHLGDIDGDELDDLVLAFSGDYVPPELAGPNDRFDPSSSGVLVFWSGDGGRGFNIDDLAALDHTLLSTAAIGAGAICLDRDDEDELAILVSGELRFFKLSRSARTLSEISSLPGGDSFILTKMVTRDVSSDGLEDLLVKDDDGVQILISLPGGGP
jgi:hypothetical protein